MVDDKDYSAEDLKEKIKVLEERNVKLMAELQSAETDKRHSEAELFRVQKDLSRLRNEMERIKAGYYRLHLVQLYDGVEEVKPHEITEKYIRLLEQTIVAKPEYWLWSHNRWKHKPDSEAKFYDNYK